MRGQKGRLDILALFNISVLVLVVFLSILLIIVSIQNGNSLNELALRLGLLGIFVFAFLLEISIQPIGPLVLAIAGLLAGMNILDLLNVILIASVLSGFAGYYIGLMNGERIFQLFGSKKEFRKSVNFFTKYGNIAMTLAALTPLPYLPMVAGMFRMKMKHFVFYAIIPRIIDYIITFYFISLFL